MTDDLFLIAHKVRGAPAFDIAAHMTCPICEATDDHCHACDGAGHWWIIPTSGHRAWPWWSCPLSEIGCERKDSIHVNDFVYLYDPRFPPMPPNLRDHYTTEREAAFSLTKALGLDKPATLLPPLVRRL